MMRRTLVKRNVHMVHNSTFQALLQQQQKYQNGPLLKFSISPKNGQMVNIIINKNIKHHQCQCPHGPLLDFSRSPTTT